MGLRRLTSPKSPGTSVIKPEAGRPPQSPVLPQGGQSRLWSGLPGWTAPAPWGGHLPAAESRLPVPPPTPHRTASGHRGPRAQGGFSEPATCQGGLRVRAPVAFSVPDAVFLLRCEVEPVSILSRALMNAVFCWGFTESHRRTAQPGLRGGTRGAEFLFELLRSELMGTEKKVKTYTFKL